MQLQFLSLLDVGGELEEAIRRELSSGRGGVELYPIKHAGFADEARERRRRERSAGSFRRQSQRVFVGVHEARDGISESPGSLRVEAAGEGIDRWQVYRDASVRG